MHADPATNMKLLLTREVDAADEGDPMSDDLLTARDLEVTFPGVHGRPDAKGVDGVDLDLARRRDPRPGGRVGLRQDDPGAHAARPRAAERR